jgi:hypothetical protein
MMGRIVFIILTPAILVLVISAGSQSVDSQETRSSPKASISQTTSSFNGYDLVDKTGNIRKPADVRDLYQFLGTYAPTDFNGDTEMHVTYASPGAAQYYRQNGKFADGTVLVKETFTTDHRPNDDRRCTMGFDDQGVVRDDQGCQESAPQ